jgi:hypothetical protein
MDADILVLANTDGTMSITSDVAVTVCGIVFADYGEEAELIAEECKERANEGKLDVDEFFAILLKKWRGFSDQMEEKFVASYNASLSADLLSSPDGVLVYDEFLHFMKGFAPGVSDDILQASFLHLIQSCPLYNVPLESFLAEAKRIGIFNTKRIGPTSVDRKKCNEAQLQLLSLLLLAKADEIQRDLQEISQRAAADPALHSYALMLQESYGDLMRYAETKDNLRMLLSSFRLFHEQHYFVMRGLPYAVQGISSIADSRKGPEKDK